MSNKRSPEWGISTGLLFKDSSLSLLQQVRASLDYNPRVIELCPNREKVSRGDADELVRIAEGEDLAYTLHSFDLLHPKRKTQRHDEEQWEHFLGQNHSGWKLADQVGALWIVQHPPQMFFEFPTPDLLRKNFGHLLALTPIKTPFLIETGAVSKNDKTEEDARDPKILKKYLNGRCIGAVGDVPKMSRYRTPRQRVKEDINLYLEACFQEGVPLKELHLVGTEAWPEDLDFNTYALEILRQHALNIPLVIESTPGRLPEIISLVKDHLDALGAARHSFSQVGSP